MNSRVKVIGSALAVAAAASILGAAPAEARERIDPVMIISANVWYQSFQRASETAPCVAPASLDIAWQSDWPAAENAWTPSWAQWPNDGKGGWVCNRQITWSPAIYMDLVT